jgi:hypothetical protein
MGAKSSPKYRFDIPEAAKNLASIELPRAHQRAASSPARCSFAKLDASRRSVLTRSPARFGISEGATTTHSCPWPDKRR